MHAENVQTTGALCTSSFTNELETADVGEMKNASRLENCRCVSVENNQIDKIKLVCVSMLCSCPHKSTDTCCPRTGEETRRQLWKLHLSSSCERTPRFSSLLLPVFCKQQVCQDFPAGTWNPNVFVTWFPESWSALNKWQMFVSPQGRWRTCWIINHKSFWAWGGTTIKFATFCLNLKPSCWSALQSITSSWGCRLSRCNELWVELFWQCPSWNKKKKHFLNVFFPFSVRYQFVWSRAACVFGARFVKKYLRADPLLLWYLRP